MMKAVAVLFYLSAACALVSPVMATPIPITASAAFTGLTSRWNFQYVSGAPDLFLQQITIDLSPTNIRFDTAAGGFGSLGFQDVGGFLGTDATTGLSTISATGAALDGGSVLTFTFANFTPGDAFTFSADVDHPNPTLLILQNCTGLAPGPKAICNAANAVRNITNAGLLLAADTVLSAQMAGAIVTFRFGGANYVTTDVQDPLQAATLQSIIIGLISGNGANSFASSTTDSGTVDTPEPATLFPFAVAAAFLYSRRRA